MNVTKLNEKRCGRSRAIVSHVRFDVLEVFFIALFEICPDG